MAICATDSAVMLKAVFLDLDGTLIDIRERELHAIRDTAESYGTTVSIDEIRRIHDKLSTKAHRLRLDFFSDIFEALGLTFTDQVLEYLLSSFLERYKLSALRTGAKDTLNILSKNKLQILCVTSRETVAEVRLELGFLGVGGIFKEIVTREAAANHFGLISLPHRPYEQQRKKLYKCALAMVGCCPSEVVVVGDMACELGPARDMGMKTIGLLSERENAADLRKASDYVILSIPQLIPIIIAR